MDRFEYRVLSTKVGRPARRRLESCRAALAGIETAQEAWEKLFSDGFLPMEWLASRERRFAPTLVLRCEDCKYTSRERCYTCENARYLLDQESFSRLSETPQDLPTCLTFGADLEGVLTAEALAKELLRTLEVFGHEGGAPSVVWRTSSFTAHRQRNNLPRLELLRDIDWKARDQAYHEALGMRAAEGALLVVARVAMEYEEARLWYSKPGRMTPLANAAINARRIALELALTGYTVDWVTKSQVFLLAPPIRVHGVRG